MESYKISRRDLLRGTALTGAGLLAAGSEESPSPHALTSGPTTCPAATAW